MDAKEVEICAANYCARQILSETRSILILLKSICRELVREHERSIGELFDEICDDLNWCADELQTLDRYVVAADYRVELSRQCASVLGEMVQQLFEAIELIPKRAGEREQARNLILQVVTNLSQLRKAAEHCQREAEQLGIAVAGVETAQVASTPTLAETTTDRAEEVNRPSKVSIAVLHITDVHLREKMERGLWDDLVALFLDDLKIVEGALGQPIDVVAFTGDAAFSGQPEEFGLFDEFLNVLYDGAWGGREAPLRPPLVAVPGNHDLVRPGEEHDTQLVGLERWSENPKVEAQYWRDGNGVIKDAFENYVQWWEGLSDLHPDQLTTGHGGLPGDFSATFEKDDIRLGLLGLNSSFLQLDKDHYLGRLAICDEQVRLACEGHRPKWLKKHNLSLLLTHHSADWLHKSQRTDLLNGRLLAPGCFAAHLCGHNHLARFTAASEQGGSLRVTSLGSSLFGNETVRDPNGTTHVERIYGYSALRIDLDRESRTAKLRQWPRIAEREPHWRFIRNVVEFDLKDEDGGTAPTNISNYVKW